MIVERQQLYVGVIVYKQTNKQTNDWREQLREHSQCDNCLVGLCVRACVRACVCYVMTYVCLLRSFIAHRFDRLFPRTVVRSSQI